MLSAHGSGGSFCRFSPLTSGTVQWARERAFLLAQLSAFTSPRIALAIRNDDRLNLRNDAVGSDNVHYVMFFHTTAVDQCMWIEGRQYIVTLLLASSNLYEIKLTYSVKLRVKLCKNSACVSFSKIDWSLTWFPCPIHANAILYLLFEYSVL